VSFREFEPPSGVLKETLEHLTARFQREIFLVAQADGSIIGSLFCARKAVRFISRAWRCCQHGASAASAAR